MHRIFVIAASFSLLTLSCVDYETDKMLSDKSNVPLSGTTNDFSLNLLRSRRCGDYKIMRLTAGEIDEVFKLRIQARSTHEFTDQQAYLTECLLSRIGACGATGRQPDSIAHFGAWNADGLLSGLVEIEEIAEGPYVPGLEVTSVCGLGNGAGSSLLHWVIHNSKRYVVVDAIRSSVPFFESIGKHIRQNGSGYVTFIYDRNDF